MQKHHPSFHHYGFKHHLLPFANKVSWQAKPVAEIEAKYKRQLTSGKPDTLQDNEEFDPCIAPAFRRARGQPT